MSDLKSDMNASAPRGGKYPVGLPPGAVLIDYTNWRGERSNRYVLPISLKFGSNEWHKEEQWMMLAHDIANGENRWFAMGSIHSWKSAWRMPAPAPTA